MIEVFNLIIQSRTFRLLNFTITLDWLDPKHTKQWIILFKRKMIEKLQSFRFADKLIRTTNIQQ